MLSRALAPEEIRPGYYVAVLYVIGEYFSCAALEDAGWRNVEPVRVRMLPWYAEHPMKVIEVCLPFVLVKEADGDYRTLDVRKHRLARVTRRFGRKASERVRAREKRNKKDDDDDDD
ncbi:MAG: hypothetical protein ABIG44_04020 [Planctomycetota bacterium]